MCNHATLGVIALNDCVAGFAVDCEQTLPTYLSLLVNFPKDVFRPGWRLQKPEPTFDEAQVMHIDGRLEADVGGFDALTTEERGERGARFFRPIQRAKDADYFSRVAANGSQSRVRTDPVPLHVIMLRNVPQEGIADGRIGTVVNPLIQFELSLEGKLL